MKRWLIMAVAVLAPSGVLAADLAAYDGQALYRGLQDADRCERAKCSGVEMVGAASAVGYVAGVGAGMALLCVPRNASFGQQADVVLKYMRDNPQTRHEPPVQQIVNAFVAVGWGCLK